MGLVKGQAKRDAVGQPFTNVKEPKPYPPEVVCRCFCATTSCSRRAGGMLAPPFKGGRSPWGEIGGGILYQLKNKKLVIHCMTNSKYPLIFKSKMYYIV